jgi:hypothetical protein
LDRFIIFLIQFLHIYYGLADADGRVRNSAAQTLLQIIPRLVWPSPLDRSAPYKAILDYVRVGFDVYTNQEGTYFPLQYLMASIFFLFPFPFSFFSHHISPFLTFRSGLCCTDKLQKDINASVSQVVHQLIDLLRDGHPEDRVRGCYHALYLISQTYSFPPNTPRLGIYIIYLT